MNSRKEAKNIISNLEKSHLYAECPCPDCNKHFLIRDAELFYLDDFSQEAANLYEKQLKELEEREKEIRRMRGDIRKKSQVGAQSSNVGKILERLAPCMNSFPFERNDCRSLFDPIDYVIFDGLSKRGAVDRIVFTDVKTGKGKLTGNQPEIRELVKRKHVSWDTYNTC